MSRTRIARSAAVEVVVDAPAEAVWAVLADVPRVGEWSAECRGARWLDGATAAAPGVRFRGSNRVRWTRWARICRVDVVDPPRELAWRTVPSGVFRDSVQWRVTLDPVDGGTRIAQTYRVLSMPRLAEAAAALALPEHRDRGGHCGRTCSGWAPSPDPGEAGRRPHPNGWVGRNRTAGRADDRWASRTTSGTGIPAKKVTMNEPDVSRPLESSQADVTLITRGITVTAVVDVSTEQTLVVRPTGEGGEWKTKVRAGDPVEVFWIAGNEERTLPARITEVEGGDELRWALAATGPSERSQRRKAVRARVAVPVVVPWSDYQLAGATIDLSEGGMRARVDGWGVPPQSGTPVRVDLDLGNRMVHLQGEMVWHTAKGATWVLAVRFVDVPERDADLIRMHVFAALRAERARSAD